MGKGKCGESLSIRNTYYEKQREEGEGKRLPGGDACDEEKYLNWTRYGREPMRQSMEEDNSLTWGKA